MYREELAERIQKIFEATVYPGDDKIGGQLVDDFIGQRDWQLVPIEVLWRNQTELPIFTADAYRFFLPAFLRAILLSSIGEAMLDSVVPSLLPSETTDMGHIADHAAPKFTMAERSIVAEFLRAVKTLFPNSAYSVLDELKQSIDDGIQLWESA